MKAKGKPRTLAPIRANAGVEAAYRKRLLALVDEMNASLLYWLRAAYRANKPLAADALPAVELQKAFRKLAARWLKRFDERAPDLAAYFATSAKDRTDAALSGALKKSGFTVEFQAPAEMRDIYSAMVSENVSLIKSIASQHLTQVEGMVMRSVTMGRDLGALTADLEASFGISRRRASLIARDQNNKATAVIEKSRQQEIGVTHAIWMHSHAGKEPRPSHVRANGTKYAVAEGLILDGERVWPGTAINCRCFSKAIIPGL